MYVASCFASVISGWILSNIENVKMRKIFSTLMGVVIQAYMYGIGKCYLYDAFGCDINVS
jgi:hypothetical protein